MTNSDGSLNFDTSVNTDGVEEGTQDIQKQFERVIKAIEGLGNKLAKSFDGLNVQNVTQELGKVDSATKSTEKRVHKTKKALDSLDDIDGPAAIKAQIESDTAALEKLNAQKTEWDDLGVPTDSGGYKELISQITELETSIKYAKSELQDLEAEQKASTSTAEAQANAENTASKANEKLDQTAKSAGSSTGKLAKKAAVNKIQLAGLGQKINAIAGNFNKLRLTAGKALSAIGKHLKSNTASAGGFGKKLKQSISMYSRVFKMMLLFQLFSSGMDLVKTQVGGALKMNAQFCASLAAIKGNLQMAFQPIYNAILPALNTLMAGVRQATIWLASFTHTLFGGTAQSSAAAAKALDEQADSTNSLAKANKKAAKSQSELDEFNIIASKDSDSGSGSGSGVKPSYDDAGLIGGQNAFAEKLKEAWKKSDFTEIGKIVADKINDALNRINWGKIQATAKKIATCLYTFLNGFVDELDWDLVGHTIAEGLNTGLIFANTFLTGFDFKNFGQGIGNGINAAVRDFDWSLLGVTLANALNAPVHTLQGFLEVYDWTALGTSLGTSINTFFSTFDWSALAFDVSGLVIGLCQSIEALLLTTDWAAMADDVINFICALDWQGILYNLVNTIATGFLTVQFVIYDVLVDIGKKVIEGFKGGFLEGIANIGQFLWNSFAQPIIDAVSNFFGISGDSSATFKTFGQNLMQGLKEGISTALTMVNDVIHNVVDAVEAPFLAVGGYLKGVFTDAWNGVISVFQVESFGQIADAIGTTFKNIINRLISGINNVVAIPFNKLDGAFSKMRNVSILGAHPFNFLPTVNAPEIPYLATGAVIPANAPFTAVLGDQRHGTNLEAPEGLIRKIMQEELAKANTGSGGNVQVNVTVQQNDEGVWRVVKTEYKKEKDMTGVDPILGF